MTDEVKMKYPANELDSFATGVKMDLRVRLAIEFLKSPMYAACARANENPDYVAEHALSVAEELLTQADAKGWLEALDDDAKLSERAIKHAKRIGAFNVHQQLGANEAAQDAQSRVVPAAPAIKAGMH